MPITDLTGTTWQLNESLADLVPDGSDYQSLSFGLTCSTTPQAASNCCVLVSSGDLNPFSTWQEFIAQIPTVLISAGATNISSAFNVIDNELTLSSIGIIEFAENEDDGYWIGPNGGWTDSSAHIEGTISFTLDNTSYTLNFEQLIATIDNYLGHPLFDTPSLKICDIDGGYSFPGADRWTITGGTAATNSDLIAWLQTNATQVLNYTLKSVSCYTKAEGWNDATNLNITNLTGTKWYFNTNPDVSMMIGAPLELYFTSNNTNYTRIRYGKDGPERFITYSIGTSATLVYQATTWEDEAYRTIEITGGSDATNSTLITWLKQNAQLWSVSLKPVRYFIKKTGSEITDLTGTTWYFNETLTNMPSDSTIVYALNYTTNNDSSTSLTLTAARLLYNPSNSGPVDYDGYVFINGMGLPCGWGKCNDLTSAFTSIPAYRTITVTGGTDATNTDLIAWIQANATLISGGQTGTYLQPVVLLQKVEEEVVETPTLITFTITPPNGSPVECQAEEGMTWYEWTNSEYNTAVFTFLGVDYSLTCASKISTVSNGTIGYGAHTLYDNTSSNEIYGVNTIIANYNYNLVHTGGGSND